MDDVNVIYLDMPTTIKAYTIKNSDNTFTIVLNSRQCREQLLLSYYHEMKHLENNDYDRLDSVNLIEFSAHHKNIVN